MLHGVDISNNNGVISLKDLSKDFAIVKASESNNFLDPDFHIFWAMMKEGGMLRGAYHFLRTTDPVSQAHVFVNKVTASGLEEDDILCADVEAPGLHSGLVKQFVNEVGRLTGKNVFIYTMYSYIQDGVVDGLYDHPLWIANPGGGVGNPPPVHPFKAWSIQQYDWQGIDKNVFNGDRATWKKLANMETKPELRQYKSTGALSFRAIATSLDMAPSTMLRLTAEHSNKAHEFSPAQAEFINEIFSGTRPWNAPVPSGIIFYYKK